MIRLKLTRKRVILAIAVLPCLLLSAQAFGQNANLSGTVMDALQAVLPGATITAVNVETGVKTAVTTNNAGVYNFASLQPGNYKVTAEMTGFQASTRTDVRLGIAASLRLNFELQVSGVTTQIEISSSAEDMLLESSSTTGVVMNEETVKELPLLGNDMMQLINVMGGVVKPENTIFGAADQTLAGVRAENINIVRDGISVNDPRFASGITSPGKINPEMIGEFKLVLTPVDAEMGRGAGQVQVLTKSGGNEYHGSGVWSILNTALDAREWDDNRTDRVPNWRNVNQYTLSASGPIIKNKTFFFVTWDQNIVKLRNTVTARALTPCARKGIYRWFPGWRNGNTLTVVNRGYNQQIRPVVNEDGTPLTPTDTVSGTPYADTLQWASVLGELTPEAQAQIAADPINCSQYDFALGNTGVVPGTNWDKDFGNYRQGYDSSGFIDQFTGIMPLPNYYGSGDGLNMAGIRWSRTTNGSDTVYGVGFDAPRKSITFKIDHNISAEHRLSGTYSYERTLADSGEANWPGAYGGANDRKPQTFTSSLTSTLRPTLLNEFRFGMAYNISHNVAPMDNPSTGSKLQDLWQQIIPTAGWEQWDGLPIVIGPGRGSFRFDPSTGHFMGGRNPYEDTWGSRDYRWTFGDTLTWTKGSHSFKFGTEIRLTKANSDMNGSGDWDENSPAWYPTIQGGFTDNSLNRGLTQSGQFPGMVGDDLGTRITYSYRDAYDLLNYMAGSLGVIRQFYFVNDPFANAWSDPTTEAGRLRSLSMNQRELAFFAKDDWKVNSDLTLNLGLRYEYYGVPWMINGLTTGFVGGPMQGIFGGSEGGFDSWLRGVPAFNDGHLTQFQFIGPNSPNPGERLYGKDMNNFGPAVGFAWQLPWFGKGKTTLRGGYQVSFTPVGRMDPNAGVMAAAGSQPGVRFKHSYTGDNISVPYMDISMLSSLVPTNRFWNEYTPQPLQLIPVTDATSSAYAYDPNIRTPYIQSLTLALTRQVGSSLTVDVRYIGTLSRKMVSSVNLNEANWIANGLKDAFDVVAKGGESDLINQMIPPNTLTFGATGSQQLRSYSRSDLATGNYESIAMMLGTTNGMIPTPAGVKGQLLRNTGLFPENFIFTNPQFGNGALNPPTGANYYGNHLYSNYHSLQGQVTLRPTHGLNLQATYTWSRSLGISPNTDPLNRALDYRLSGQHRSHALTTFGTYNLPLGPSGYVFRDSSGWVKKLVEGWQLSWISSLTSGLPASISTVQSMWGGSGVDLIRPDLFDTKGGNVTWEHGADYGLFFGNKYMAVDDPRCATLDPSLQGSCRTSLRALAVVTGFDADGNPIAGDIVFQKAQPGVRGNFDENQIMGPGRWGLDMAMSKNVEFMEGKSINFRVDVTNIFNHPTPSGGAASTYNSRDYWYSNPTLNLNSSDPFGYIGYKGGHRVFSAKVRINF